MGFLDRIALRKVDPPAAGYRVQLLLPRPAVLNPVAIHRYLRTWRDDVQLVGTDPARFAIAIPTGTPIPVVVHVFQAPVGAYARELAESLTWSQIWRDRREVVARACESFVVATTIESGPAYAAQILSLQAVLDTVLVSLDERDAAATVLHWIPAQQVMPCIRYRLLRKELGPSGPVVNVRVSVLGGRPGEMLADTVGFAPLGLPDLQVRFCNRDPNEVALRMMLLAKRQFLGEELDDAIEDTALAGPAREVLTIALD